MGMFSQMGDMYKLQKEAKRLKKELAQTHISAEEAA
jgi:DNA-binding protein YbaB